MDIALHVLGAFLGAFFGVAMFALILYWLDRSP